MLLKIINVVLFKQYSEDMPINPDGPRYQKMSKSIISLSDLNNQFKGIKYVSLVACLIYVHK